MDSKDFELDEMTSKEVTIETCLDILRLADLYGMRKSRQEARTLALNRFEEVCVPSGQRCRFEINLDLK